jgi:hypothetical protein
VNSWTDVVAPQDAACRAIEGARGAQHGGRRGQALHRGLLGVRGEVHPPVAAVPAHIDDPDERVGQEPRRLRRSGQEADVEESAGQ